MRHQRPRRASGADPRPKAGDPGSGKLRSRVPREGAPVRQTPASEWLRSPLGPAAVALRCSTLPTRAVHPPAQGGAATRRVRNTKASAACTALSALPSTACALRTDAAPPNPWPESCPWTGQAGSSLRSSQAAAPGGAAADCGAKASAPTTFPQTNGRPVQDGRPTSASARQSQALPHTPRPGPHTLPVWSRARRRETVERPR